MQGADTSTEAVATLRSAVAARRKATVELLNYKKTGELPFPSLHLLSVASQRGGLWEPSSAEGAAAAGGSRWARRSRGGAVHVCVRAGEAFWNRLSITPVFNDAGELVSYIGVQSDVTELIRRKVRVVCGGL